MAGELDALRVAQDLPERRAGRRRDAARGLHGRIERRRQRAGRDDRRVVRELAHRTWVTTPASMPPLPSTVRVAVPSFPMSTAETTPVWAVLVVASVYVTVRPIRPSVLARTSWSVEAAVFVCCSSCEN